MKNELIHWEGSIPIPRIVEALNYHPEIRPRWSNNRPSSTARCIKCSCLVKDSRVILIFSWTKIIFSCSTESSVKFNHSSTILYYMPDKIFKCLGSRIIRNFFTFLVRTGISAFEAAFWKFVWPLMLCKAVNVYIVGDSRDWEIE